MDGTDLTAAFEKWWKSYVSMGGSDTKESKEAAEAAFQDGFRKGLYAGKES